MNIIHAASKPAGRRLRVLPLYAVAITVLSGVSGLAPASADQGCIPGDISGQVPRLTRPSDNVCVPPNIAQTVVQENADAAAGKGYAGGGAYGPKTCVNGLVWREGYDGDAVCVSPQRRTETWQENANADVGATGGLQPQAQQAGAQSGTAGSPDSALLNAVNDARLHPEKYPPQEAGAPTLNACTSPFNASSGLDGAASKHIGFISNVSRAVVEASDSQGNPNAHRNPPPSGPLSWDNGGPIAAAGYNTKRGEIVAFGQGSEATAVSFWMQNDAPSGWGHRKLILDCTLSDAGAAHLAGGVEGQYWVVDMGTR